MSEVALIVLGIRLFVVLFQNSTLLAADRDALNAVAMTMLSGQQPTAEQWATFNSLTAKIIAAELAAAIPSVTGAAK